MTQFSKSTVHNDARSEALGARIRERRVARQITLRKLAADLGVSPGTMSAVENGRTGISAVRLSEVASLLHVPVESLFGEASSSQTLGQDLAASETRQTDWRVYDPAPLDASLEAAVEAFLEYGYHGSTMRDIARRAGLSVPGVYHHYASKQEMLVTIMNATMDDLLWRCHAALDELDGPVERFKALTECLALYHTRRRDWGFLGRSELRSLEGEGRIAVREKRIEVQSLINREIEAGRDAGVFRVANPSEAGRAVVSLCVGIALWFSDDGIYSPEEVARDYVDFSLGVVRYQN